MVQDSAVGVDDVANAAEVVGERPIDVAVCAGASDLFVGEDHVHGWAVEVAVGEVVIAVERKDDMLAVIDVLDNFGGARAGAVAVNDPFNAPTKPRLMIIK